MKVRSGQTGDAARGGARWWAKALIACLGTVALAPTLLGPATADAAGRIEVQVAAGYDGYARQDEWSPVQVTLRNDGDDFRGRLRVDDAAGGGGGSSGFSGYRGCCAGTSSPVGFAARELDVVVPAHSTRHFTVYLAGAQQPRATLLSGGNTVATGEAGQALVFTNNSGLLVGVVSDQPDTLDQLGVLHLGGGITPHVFHLKPAELPASGVILRSFDLLAFDDASTDSLSAAQRDALRDYMLAGGGLLLVGGPSARKTLAGIPAELQPVAVTGTVRDDLHVLGALAGSPAPSGGAELSRGSLAKGAVGMQSGDVPVIAWLQRGAGTVVYTAFDATAEPVTSWPAGKTVLRQVVTRAARAAGTGPPTKGFPSGNVGNFRGPAAGPGLDFNSVSSVINNLPSLEIPALGMVGWLLLFYALLVGPLNYVVLKRMRRRHLAWLTIPAMVAVSSSAVLLVGLNVKGVGTHVNQVRVAQVAPGSSRQYVVSYSGVVVAHRGDYTLGLDDNAFVGAATMQFNGFNNTGGGITIDGQPPQAALPGMTAYSVRTVAAEGYSAAGGTLDADLHLTGSTIAGTITNHTPRDIEDAFVVYRGAYQPLGVLRPGASPVITVNGSTPNLGGDMASQVFPNPNPGSKSAADRQEERRRQVLRGLGNAGNGWPMLIGFVPSGLPRPAVNGVPVEVEGENVLIMTIPPSLDPRATSVRAGAVSPRFFDYDGDAQLFPPGPNGTESLRLTTGSAVVEFDLPGGGWKTADVGVGLSPGASVESVYNFRSGRWDPLTARLGRAALDPGAGQVSDQGLVLVRFASSGPVANSVDVAATRPGAL